MYRRQAEAVLSQLKFGFTDDMTPKASFPQLNRRRFLKAFALALADIAVSPSANTAPYSRSPNIVLILSDDVGFGDVSCYGAKDFKTPNIDRLAQNGLRFTDAHSVASTCTPSRYALLTGTYSSRKDGVQILPGDASLLIDTTRSTMPSVLKKAKYVTGCVGKWHVGLGNAKIDWNSDIEPGPLETGFDYSFIIPATADRVPTVFVENHRVVGLDPNDPIEVSYAAKVGDEPTGKEDPQLLKMKLSEGHDGTIVDGVSRIGFMSGGHAARWVDENMAATLAGKAGAFIEKNREKPFFLYFTPSDIHVPRMPNAQFAGTTSCGVRCDVIEQLDWTVGQIMTELERHNLAGKTLVIFTSDNGPVVNDGYDDGSDRLLDGHKPAGPYRGGKYSIYEGGTRIPFIAHWPGHIKPGVSDALIDQVDLMRSFAALTGASVPKTGAPDSMNVSSALLGHSRKGRSSLVEESQWLAIRQGQWKLVDRNERPGHLAPFRGENQPVFELYDLKTDPGETTNVAESHPEIVQSLSRLLEKIRTQGHS